MNSPTAPTCGYCGEPIIVPAGRRGPKPSYCSPAHRQRAHQHRLRARPANEPDRVEMLEHNVARLSRLMGALEHQHRQLSLTLDVVQSKLDQLSHPESMPYPAGYPLSPDPPAPERRSWVRRHSSR